jgi:hypothetical protein
MKRSTLDPKRKIMVVPVVTMEEVPVLSGGSVVILLPP